MAHTKGVVSNFYGLLAKPYGTPDLSGGSGVAVGHDTTPFVSAYPWTNQVGFGTKYANPATLPAGTRVGGVGFTPNADTIFLASNGGVFIQAYPWSTAGFGTKYANPAVGGNGEGTGIAVRSLAASANYHVAMSDNDGAAAIFINAWRFSKTGAGWGTKFTNPVTLPAGTGLGVAFSPDGLNIAVAHLTTPFVTAYPWSDSGFGTKRANPAVLAEGGGTGVAFSKLGAAISIAHSGVVNNITAWGWASGFGTKYADPSYPGGWFPMGGESIAFRSDAVALGHNFSATNTNAYTAWRWTDGGGFGTRYGTNASLNVAGQGSGPAWNELGDTFFGSLVPTPRVRAFHWNSTAGFGTAYSDPATLPTGVGNALAVAA